MGAVERVAPKEAWALLQEGYTYVDVRSEPEYAAGHPKGALNVPWAQVGAGGLEPNGDFERVMRALFPLEAKLVLGCATGVRSLSAAQRLLAAGFERVVDQRAGFVGPRDPFGRAKEPGWAASGLPVESETPGGSYADVLARLPGT